MRTRAAGASCTPQFVARFITHLDTSFTHSPPTSPLTFRPSSKHIIMSLAISRNHSDSIAEQPTVFLFTDLTTDKPSSTFLFADFTTAKVNAWRRYKSRMHMRRTAANRPPTSFDRTYWQTHTHTSPKAASTQGSPFPAFPRIPGSQTGQFIAYVCISAMASMATLPQALEEPGADWVAVADVQRLVLMLITAFILTDTIAAATAPRITAPSEWTSARRRRTGGLAACMHIKHWRNTYHYSSFNIRIYHSTTYH